MTHQFFLFDMDGVLLKPRGYHQSLQASVHRIGAALGAPNTELSENQIARFEALDVTNEWDSLAISTALILIHLWEYDPDLRLDGLSPDRETITQSKPDFDQFLGEFSYQSELPGRSAYHFLLKKHAWLTREQQTHLFTILHFCRDIFKSPTLPGHQETVLGSQVFTENYNLSSKLSTDSYLLKFDRPLLSGRQKDSLRKWLLDPSHHAGIMTNRPSSTPPGYLSSPEAELGAKLVGLEDLPVLGSGMLAWYAVTQRQLPDFTFLKPNPVHALALLQMCGGNSARQALNLAADLWLGENKPDAWEFLQNAQVTIFEDAAKGLRCGIAAKELLTKMGIDIELSLIGVTQNKIKRKALQGIADHVITSIQDINWQEIY